jgi:hypothetical protein
MGSFSWLRADNCTKRHNISLGDSYKILIPQEFGGGYIKDKYYDYGYINYEDCAVYVDPNGKKTKLKAVSDLYGVLAYMNIDKYGKSKFNTATPHILDIVEKGNTHSDSIRCSGIDIGCYDDEINALEFPLKLVSATCKDTYETCKERSYGDPEQGFYKY